MSVKRSRPANPAVRKSAKVGPEYAETRYDNPWAAGLSNTFGDMHDKSVYSDNGATFEGGGAPLNQKGRYDAAWEGK